MKRYQNKRRVLSLLLAIMTLTASLPGVSLSEEQTQLEPVIEEAEQTAQDTEPAETEDADLPGSGIDSTRDASYSPAFLTGYAALLEDAELDGEILPTGAVVYVYDRALDDTLSVCADTAERVLLGTLPAAQLRPLSEEETAECVTVNEDTHYFDAEETIPLVRLAPTEETEDAELIQVEEIEETEDPDATLEPIPDLPSAAEEESEPEETTEPVSKTLTEYLNVLTVMVGQTIQGERFAGATWVSDDPSIATITDSALLTGVSEGETYITETLVNGDQRRWKVCVTRPVSGIALNRSELKLGLKETYQLTAIFPEGESGDVTWTSSAPKAASVSSDGLVTAVGASYNATITASCDGWTASCKVKTSYAPARVTLSDAELEMGVGEKTQIAYSLDGRYSEQMTFAVTDGDAVSVSEDGYITALHRGTAEVTLTTYNGKSAVQKVTVYDAPDSVVLDETDTELIEGQSVSLTARIPEGTRADFTWTSSDADVVSVDSLGTVKAVGAGDAVVTVSAGEGVTASRAFHVTAAPDHIDLESSVKLGVGESMDLNAVLPEGTAAELKWTTSASKYVTVTQDGHITAIKKGTAKITVTAHNGVKAVCTVQVLKAPTSVSVSPASLTVAVGQTKQLTATYASGTYTNVLTWTTEDSAVSVDETTGAVTGLTAGGTATVRVTTGNGKTAVCTVNVIAAPTWVHAGIEEITIGAGDTVQLNAVAENGMTDFVYASENKDIASVSADGEIKALSEGDTVINVSLYNGVHDSVTVHVKPAPETIGLESAVKLGVGESADLHTVLPEGTVASLKWTTSASKYVTVTQDGHITAVKTGTAKITVTAHNGVKAVCTVQVLKAPTSVSVSPASLTVAVGQTKQLTATYTSGTYTNVLTWTTDSNAISVNETTGEVTGLAALTAGETATVRVTTGNGKTAVCTVNVIAAPTSVTADMEEITLGAGDTVQLNAVADNGMADFVYASEDEDIASVSADGEIKALSEGDTVINVSLYNGVSDSVTVHVKPAPETIGLESAVKLGVGESADLHAVLPEGTEASLKWTTSASKYVTVTQDGHITAVKTGTAKITVTAHNGVKAVCTVQVLKAPTSVSVSPASLTVAVGQTKQLTATYTSGTYTNVLTWTTDSNAISVNETTGEVTGLAALTAGETATVKVTTGNGKTAACTVNVIAAPTFVNADIKEITLGAGETAQVTASADNGMTDFEYTSEDAAIAAVDANGQIKALTEGDTAVRVSLYNGVYDTVTVHVIAAPKTIDISETSLTLGVGETWQLTAVPDNLYSAVAWTSSSAKYVTVSEDGLVTAVKAGSVTVKAATYNGVSASVKVTVKAAPSSVTVSPAQKEVVTGESFKLSLSIPSGTMTHLTLTADDPAVISLGEDGTVTGLTPGEAVVTATAHNGRTAACRVTVYQAPTSVKMDQTAAEMNTAEKLQLAVCFNEGEYSPLTWSSSNAAVATVTQGGLVTCLSGGTAVIRAQTNVPGVYAECEITGWAAPASVTLPENDTVLALGKTYQLKPVIPEYTRTTFTYASSNPESVSVDENGLVTAVKHGSATVTVKTANGKSASMTVMAYDIYAPVFVTITNAPGWMKPDAQIGLTTEVTGAWEGIEPIAALIWTSSKESVATVSEDGLLTAVASGTAEISCVSARNSACKASFTLYVSEYEKVTTLPEWQTAVSSSAISGNHNAQKNIYECAADQVNILEAAGEITSAEATARNSILSRGYDDIYFTWITPAYQGYWKAANSEGGVKDFRTNIAYFGVPYTSNSDTRRYCKEKLLSERRYTDSGKGYYVLNQGNLLSGRYCGSDCSAFAGQAYWGTSSSYSYLVTSGIASSGAYKTVEYDDLRTGDLINKGSAHVVVFLYWLDDEHTTMMIMENGGAWAGTNTCHYAINTRSYYEDKGYRCRRRKDFA